MKSSASPRGVAATADRAVVALKGRGIELFARVDHAGAARAIGLERMGGPMQQIVNEITAPD
jgi:hypothetical protein